MSGQTNKDTKGFHERVKSFFKFKGPGITRSKSDEQILLTDELIAELGPGNPLGNRLKIIKDFNEYSNSRRLESHTTERLWELIHDLLKPENAPKEIRHIVLGLFTNISKNQIDKNGPVRGKFFGFIQQQQLHLQNSIDEDAGPRFRFLVALTNNGKNISYFEEKIGLFILASMPNIHSGGSGAGVNGISTKDFMSWLVNIVKFNQSCLDPEVLEGIIQNVCFISCTSEIKDDVLECLEVLSAVICYPSLPQGSLKTLLATLCRTVNSDYSGNKSWKIMRDLLGTHLGHTGIYLMCQFLEASQQAEEFVVLRGAVFFIGTVLWGNRLIRSLRYPPATVLLCFKQALERKHPYVSFEVIMRVLDLVKNRSELIQPVAWDLILEVIEKVCEYSDLASGTEEEYSFKIFRVVNETLDLIDAKIATSGIGPGPGLFGGTLDKFYSVIDTCGKHRSEKSMEKLLEFKMTQLLHAIRPGWFDKLILFAEKHFRLENRPVVRALALLHLKSACLANRDTHEDELIDRVLLVYLKNLETENHLKVRQSGVRFITEFMMESNSKKGHDLLHILEKIVNRPYEMPISDSLSVEHIYSESEVADIYEGVQGLIKLFQKKIYYLPSSLPISAYKSILKHLNYHYRKPTVLEQCSSIRFMIFESFFKIRANSKFQIGICDTSLNNPNCVKFSPFIAVIYEPGPPGGGPASAGSGSSAGWDDKEPTTAAPLGSTSPSQQPAAAAAPTPTQPPQVTNILLRKACDLVVQSIRKEKDWKVLELILKQIPYIMENKALILCGNDIMNLSDTICPVILEKPPTFENTLKNLPEKFQRTNLLDTFYPILTALISYHAQLKQDTQKNIVKCLEGGLLARNSRHCILAMTSCILEMSATMHKLLPDVLLKLSRITPKRDVAIPVLEFLSTLTHLPSLYASFTQDQYMSIFAIALPYTNPFKFSQYTVSLAHHVIAMWFLKCRISFRKGFASYIKKGLISNVWAPIEEETRRSAQELQNEDSSNRKRSSSLTDQSKQRGGSGRERPISGNPAAAAAQGATGTGAAPAVGTGGPATTTTSQNKSTGKDAKNALDKSLHTFHQELTETCDDLLQRYAFADSSALPTRFQSTAFLMGGSHNTQSWCMGNKFVTITTSGCTQKELRDNLCDKCWLLCRKPNVQTSSSPSPSPSSPSKSLGGKSNDDSNNAANRRRHRSEFGPTWGRNEDDLEMSLDGNDSRSELNNKTKDDMHLEHKIRLPGTGTSGRNLMSDESSSPGPVLSKQKGDQLCSCWCQGWAEILIRCPTGNTSWVMKIQNQIGNSSSNDVPLRELSAMFLKHAQTDKEKFGNKDIPNGACPGSPTSPGNNLSSEGSSANCSPIHYSDPALGNKLESELEPSTSPTRFRTSSPQSVGSRSPTEPQDILFDPLREHNPVRRSNSSPEMSDSWKSPFQNLQTRISEQDEDEQVTPSPISKAAGGLDLSSLSHLEVINQNHKKFETKDVGVITLRNPDRDRTHYPTKGSTSPYRGSYEAIPEEVSSKDLHSQVQPLQLAVSPRRSVEKPTRLLSQFSAEDSNSSIRSTSGSGRGLDKESTTSTAPPPQPGTDLAPLRRDRNLTIGVMDKTMRNKGLRRILSTGSSEVPLLRREFDRGVSEPTQVRSSMSPQFVFLQLCYQGSLGSTSSKPLPIPNTPGWEKGLKVFDYIPPYETHKIGVLYVGPGQTKNEGAILGNMYGSGRYRDFLQGLGKLVKLKEVDPQKTYLGGLSTNGDDGDFAYIWQDDVMQVMFHVATLMPNKQGDIKFGYKKRHIGNDYVAIIYNNSDEDYDISTITGQFLYACVVIQPLDHFTNRVVVKAKPTLTDQIGHSEAKIVSDQNLPVMARQLALHSNLASHIFESLNRPNADPYASNWLERLRKIKNMKARLLKELGQTSGNSSGDESAEGGPVSQKRSFIVDDFTEFV